MVEVVVEGTVDPESRWFMDYGDILSVCEPVRLDLDHKVLNEIPGLEAGTAEILSVYIWNRILDQVPGLKAVVVHETSTSSCTYFGP